jgi:hypothetical protein
MKKETENIPDNLDFKTFNRFLKPRSFIYRIWYDPVFSGLIVLGIASLITLIYSFLKSLISDINFWDILKEILVLKISLWIILVIIILFYLLWIIKNKWLKSFDNKRIDKILKTKLGDFNFSELHNTLLNHSVKNPPELQIEGLEKGHLLGYFLLFARNFNLGVSYDLKGAKGHFMYWKVGALLISYGLVYNETVKKESDEYDEIYTTELGKRFYRLYQKYKYYLNENYNDW